jgi:hypothetical protein
MQLFGENSMNGDTNYLSQINIRGLFMIAGMVALSGSTGLFLFSGSNPISRHTVFLAQSGASLLLLSIYFLLTAAALCLWRWIRTLQN